MPVAKRLTLPKLFEYLDEEVKLALIGHELLSLFDYSWINEYDPDPEFIGLYKWSLDGSHGLFQADCDDNFYTQIQFESLSIICSDLEALMDVSRLAIGNALWMADMVKADVFDHHHHFWLNHINSMTLLGMASDRVRDLFLLVVFDEDFKHYVSSRKGRRKDIGEHQSKHYQYPFYDAISLPKMEKCASQLISLQVLAKSIYEKRNARNTTVHEVATQAGILTKRWFQNNEAQTAARLSSQFSVTSDTLTKAQNSHLNTIETSLGEVIEWYLNLVRATSQVFDIEHTLRTKKMLASPKV